MNLRNLFTRALVATLSLIGAGDALAARTTTYYHTDGLGSVVAATNEAGAVLWRKDYAPFGEQLEGSNAGEKVAYTGKQHDVDIGLTNFGARQYDPEIGRFLSVDPQPFVEDNTMSFNRYLYGNNNPYMYVDPDGESPVHALKFALDVGLGIGINLLTTGQLGVGAALKDSALGIMNPAKTAAKAGRIFNLLATRLSKTKGVDLQLKYKPDWTASQRAAACAKCEALTRADTVVTKPQRSGTSASSRYKSAGNQVPAKHDVDHVQDLQLGGRDSLSNMAPLDSSVNRSLGAQIHQQTRSLPEGTRINRVRISD